MKYFSSDFHFSHKGVIAWSNRPFSDVNEMNDVILDNILTILKPGDDLYFLGDLSWDHDFTRYFFSKIRKINFHWILGNHEKAVDIYRKQCRSMTTLKEVKVGGTTTTLCHYPMLTWNKSHYNSYMLHGHHHANSNGTSELAIRAPGKILNVNVEFHDYKPWSEEEIVEYMKTRPDNWDIVKRGEDEGLNV